MERKRIWWLYGEIDFQQIEERLEQLRKKGWILDKVNGLYATFERGNGEEVVYSLAIGEYSKRKEWLRVGQVGGITYYIGKRGCSEGEQGKEEKIRLSSRRYLSVCVCTLLVSIGFLFTVIDGNFLRGWSLITFCGFILICILRWWRYFLMKYGRDSQYYMKLCKLFNKVENVLLCSTLIVLFGMIILAIGM